MKNSFSWYSEITPGNSELSEDSSSWARTALSRARRFELDLLGVAAVDAVAVDECEGLEGAVDRGQVGGDNLDEGALVDDERVRGPARGGDDQAVGVAEPVVLGRVGGLDQTDDGDLDGVHVVAPEGVDVERLAGGDAELAGGGCAEPDLDAGASGGVGGGGRGGGGGALDERDVGADVGEEEEVGAGAQVVLLVDGLAGVGQEEGGGTPIDAGPLDEPAAVAAEEVQRRVAALQVDGGLGGLAVADHLEVEVERFLLAQGEAEAEVAHGVGVEDDARHEGGRQHHAEDDGGEQPPVCEASLGDDAQERGEAVHGVRRQRTGERPAIARRRWVADGRIVGKLRRWRRVEGRLRRSSLPLPRASQAAFAAHSRPSRVATNSSAGSSSVSGVGERVGA